MSARAAAEGWAAQALMPHRRALGEKAVDQLAESELGRLALRGELEPVLATAGADYARHWRGCIASLCAARRREQRLKDGRRA